MGIEYRLLHPDEEQLAVALWTETLKIDEYEALNTFRDFHDDPERFKRAHVAVDDNGQLLSSVCYWLRDVRDISGRPVRIGHLFHVATAESARRQGHATSLLTRVIHDLLNASCHWAILGAREDAANMYLRMGWQPTPRLYWRGSYSKESWHDQQRYPVHQYDPRLAPDGWSKIAAVYEKCNAQQAGSLIRTPAYWSGYAVWMFGVYLDHHEAILLTVGDGSDQRAIRGYVLAHFYSFGFLVSEIATDTEDPKILASLLNAIILEAQNRGIPLQGQLTVPSNPIIHAVLTELFGSTLHSVDDTAIQGYASFMVRPIGDVNTSPFAPPQGLFWPLDAY